MATIRSECIAVETRVVFMAIVYGVGFALGFVLWKYPVPAFLAFAAAAGINMRFWHTRTDNVLFLVGALAGPLGEVAAIQMGVWRYAGPTVLGVPLWLPLLWGGATVMISRVAPIVAAAITTKRRGRARFLSFSE